MDWKTMQDWTALELARRIRAGELRAVDAAAAALDAIAAIDGQIHAVLYTAREDALAQAEAVDQAIRAGEAVGPLAGVPLLIKDNICEKGRKTTCASRILEGFCPPYDATAVEKLRAAGAVLVGKSNMDEFAMGSTTETSVYGATANPWDHTRVPGGSSGGAAAAVAAREIPAAIGSDTGGSIRQPASYCGVTGLKPTYGTVSRYGLIAYASSLDQIGPLARDAADCAALFDVLRGKDPRDATSLDVAGAPTYGDWPQTLEGLRIGLPEDWLGEGLEAPVREAILRTAETLRALGATVESCSLPMIRYAVPTYYIIAAAEASSNLSRFDGVKYGRRAADAADLTELYAKSRSEGFGDEVQRRILLGTFALSAGYYDAYYKKALQVKGLIQREFETAFASFDLLLAPVSPTTAPKLGASLADPLKMYLGDIYTVSVNLAGLPALSMPCGFDPDGLPVGAQLIAKPLAEATLLRTAGAFQAATDYHKQMPKEVR